MTRVAEHTPTETGRPSLIPWDTELPTLVTMRHHGDTYAEIAAMLTQRYGKDISTQAVRGQFAKRGLITAEGEEAFENARRQRIEARDTIDAERIADFLVANPGTSQPEIAQALDLPVHRVSALKQQALRSRRGYYIPAAADTGRERYTREDIVDAIRHAAAFHQLAPGGEFELDMYETWRATIPTSISHYPASTQVWDRKFRTVNAAIEAAGYTPKESPRDYDGLEYEHLVVWIAHWLRDLRAGATDGLVEVRLDPYRDWATAHGGPGHDSIKKRGSFTKLCHTAARLEQKVQVLPERKPLSKDGRHKSRCSTCLNEGAHPRTGLCDEHAERCDYTDTDITCGQPAHYDGLCLRHEQQRLERERAESRTSRWRTYYLVYWPDHRTFKVGLEASGGKNGPQRINKWRRTGATIVTRIVHTGHNDAHAAELWDIEQDLKNDLPNLGYAHPDRQQWLTVVGASSPHYPTSPDGWTETFVLPHDADVASELDYLEFLMLETVGDHSVDGNYIGDSFVVATEGGVEKVEALAPEPAD